MDESLSLLGKIQTFVRRAAARSVLSSRCRRRSLYEIEYGKKFTLNIKLQNKKPIDDYLKRQGRFRNLKPADIQALQADVEKEWKRILKKAQGCA